MGYDIIENYLLSYNYYLDYYEICFQFTQWQLIIRN